MNENIVDCLRI